MFKWLNNIRNERYFRKDSPFAYKERERLMKLFYEVNKVNFNSSNLSHRSVMDSSLTTLKLKYTEELFQANKGKIGKNLRNKRMRRDE